MARPVWRALAVLAAFLSTTAVAAPVRWTIPETDTRTLDGPNNLVDRIQGVYSGSFVYDADTDTYSDIEIRLDSSSVSDFDTNFSALFGSSEQFLALDTNASAPLAGALVVRLEFQSLLTNSGGRVFLERLQIGQCVNNSCLQTSLGDGLFFDFGFDPATGEFLEPNDVVPIDGFEISGAPIVADVPLPAPALLLLCGLGALGVVRLQARQGNLQS